MDETADDADQRDDGRAVTHDAPEFSRDVLESDRIYDALAHVRRRYLCYLLCEHAELQVEDAVAAIADWESEEQPAAELHRERVRLSLLHSHIPKLRDRGIVDFDPHSETLVTGDDAEAVLTALQAVGRSLPPEPSTTDDGSEPG